MAPRENRRDSYSRAARAALMRAAGATFQRIADEEGYPNRRAAQLAVERHWRREGGAGVESQRMDAYGSYHLVKSRMMMVMTQAAAEGDFAATVAAGKAAADVVSRQVMLLGLAVPVRQQVDVQVTESPTVLLDRLETALLERAAQQTALPPAVPIIEAETEELA